VGLVAAGFILLINRALPGFRIQFEVLRWIAIALVIVGLLIELYSVFLFFRARTTVNPLKPDNSSSLVISGLYRYSRNPMYVGMLFLLTGLVLWVGNIAGLAALLFLVWYITLFQIKPEEVALERKFGQQFTDYANQVRRWV